MANPEGYVPQAKVEISHKGKKHKVDLSFEQTIADLKSALATETGIPSDNQRVLVAGKFRSPEETIGSLITVPGRTVLKGKLLLSESHYADSAGMEQVTTISNLVDDLKSKFSEFIKTGIVPGIQVDASRHGKFLSEEVTALLIKLDAIENIGETARAKRKMLIKELIEIADCIESNSQAIDTSTSKV